MHYRKRFEQRRFDRNAPEKNKMLCLAEAVDDATRALIDKMDRSMEATERLDFQSFRVDVSYDARTNYYIVHAFIASERKQATTTEILMDPTFTKAQYDGTSNMDGLIPGGGEDNEPGT